MTKIKNYFRIFRKGFTLVELIIVIAIVAILSVVAFMVVTKWIGKSRDSRRLSDLGAMRRSLEITLADTNFIPLPDAPSGGSLFTGTIGGKDVAYAGVFGDGVTKTSKNIGKAPKDPTTQNNYAYGVDSSFKKYEVAVSLEDGTLNSSLFSNAFAATPIAKVDGNYSISDMYVYDPSIDKVVAVPSLIFTGAGLNVILTDKDTTKYIVDKGLNLPYSMPEGGSSISETAVQSLARILNRGVSDVPDVVVFISGSNSATYANGIANIVPDKIILQKVADLINTKENLVVVAANDVTSATIPTSSFVVVGAGAIGGLVGGKSLSACTSAGGTVFDVGGSKICKFTAAVCPAGWTQYSNWSTTSVNNCDHCTACSTLSHSFGDISVESCSYSYNSNGLMAVVSPNVEAGMSCTFTPSTCYANVTEVGCQ